MAHNVMTQSLGFAVLAGCPLRKSAHCSSQLCSSPLQKRAAELEKCREGQQGRPKLWKRFCGGLPRRGLPQAVIPQIPLKSMSWNEEPTPSTTKVSLTCALTDCSWDAGCRYYLMTAHRLHPAIPWREEARRRSWFCSVCRIVKVILVGSSPFYTYYCIWYKLSGVT